MFFQVGAQKQSQVLNEVLLVFLAILVGISDIGAQGKHLEFNKLSHG